MNKKIIFGILVFILLAVTMKSALSEPVEGNTLEQINWGINYTFDKIKSLININSISNIGEKISPSNPTIGWVIFAIILYSAWVLLITFPPVIKQRIKRYNGSLDMKTLIIIALLLFGFGMFWIYKNMPNLEKIGEIISPSNHILGWFLFLGFIYYGWLLVLLIPSLVKREFSSLTGNNLLISLIVIGSTFFILYWAITNVEGWKDLGPTLSPSNPSLGWIIVAVFTYYIYWVLFTFIPNLTRKKVIS